METILFVIIAAAFHPLKDRSVAAFVVIFVLIQFFFQFVGLLATIFLLSESKGRDLDYFEDNEPEWHNENRGNVTVVNEEITNF